MDTQSNRKSHYHWFIFAIGFLMVFCALGFNSSIKSTYLKSVTDQNGWDRAAFEIGSSIRYITTALLNMIFGTLVARFGARKLIAAGFTCLSCYCLICSFATELFHFYIANFFFGCGLAWSTTSIVGVIVEKWFTNSKGTIMGIILAANGLGGFVAEWVITPIINGADKVNGINKVTGGYDDQWRTAYLVTACIMIVVGIIAVLVMRNKPEDLCLEPLGKDKVAKKKRGADWVGFEMSDLKKKGFFYVAAVCVFITGFVLNSFNGNAKPHMYDVGFTQNYVIMVFGAHSLVLTLSKILAGISFDKFGIRFTFGYCSVAAIVSLYALYSLTIDSTIAPWIYSIISSVALPLETIMIPLLVAEMFGKKCYSKIMGYFLGLNTLGYALGAIVVNKCFDLFGSYKGIFGVLGVILTINLIVIQFAFIIAKKERVTYENKLAAEQSAN